MQFSRLGSVERNSADSMKVQNIIQTANTAEGQKQVLQAMALLSSSEIKILGEQRTIMAQSLKAQTTHMLQEAQERTLREEQEQNIYKRNPTLSGENAPKINILK